MSHSPTSSAHRSPDLPGETTARLSFDAALRWLVSP